MVANIAFNPLLQTNAAGMFTIESDGFVVGTAMPDPAVRFQLAGGWLATTETLPMYGGLAISDIALGGIIGRGTVAPATGGAGVITGFSVFDQNYAAVNTPQSPVPVVGSGGLVNFYRLGSLARVALAADPALAAAVETGTTPITVPLYWDATNLRVTATVGTNLLIPVKLLAVKGAGCMLPVYTAATGFVTWNYNGAAALCLL